MHPQLPEYEGYGALIPLDYGHHGHDAEHSLLLVPTHWRSLRDLLEWPYAFLKNAHDAYGFDASTMEYKWDVLGPMTIILDPLTIPSRASAEGLRILAAALANRHECDCDCESPYGSMSEAIRDVIPQWQGLNHEQWREKVIESCTEPGKPCQGFYLVEYALLTRVIVVRYVPPALSEYVDDPFYNDNITAVTFSDFLHGMGAHFLPRTAYMHFDLKPARGSYTHGSVARLKANFTMDYITGPIWTLSRLCNPWTKRLDQGDATYEYHYASATFASQRNILSITTKADALESTEFPVTENKEPRLDRVNGDHDPTVILESVDPWCDGWVWKNVPTVPSPEWVTDDTSASRASGSTQRVMGASDDEEGLVDDPSTPYPCILIYITVNGEGQWVIDPSSTLVKNYVAPTLGGGS